MPGYPNCCRCDGFGAIPEELNVTLPSGYDGTGIAGTHVLLLTPDGPHDPGIPFDLMCGLSGDLPIGDIRICALWGNTANVERYIRAVVGYSATTGKSVVAVGVCGMGACGDYCGTIWAKAPHGISSWTNLDGLLVPYYFREPCIVGVEGCEWNNGSGSAEDDVLIEVP